jgi:lipid-binding SYLF domain-containing protein
MKNRAPSILGTTASVLAAFVLAGCAGSPPAASTPDASTPAADKVASADVAKKRDERRKLRDETLAKLYEGKPEVRDELAKAEGYAVFQGTQLNLVLYVGASGNGILVDNKTGAETFMTMKRAGTGPGAGYKDYRQVMVFKSRALFDQFKSVGADVSASADATLKRSADKGTSFDPSISFNPQLSVYQITDRGMLLQANWGGVAYLPDSDLN